MTTKFEQFLDCLNSYARALDRVTRRRRRWNREQLKTALTLGSTVLSGVAIAVPKVRAIALAVEGVQRAAALSDRTPQLQPPYVQTPPQPQPQPQPQPVCQHCGHTGVASGGCGHNQPPNTNTNTTQTSTSTTCPKTDDLNGT